MGEVRPWYVGEERLLNAYPVPARKAQRRAPEPIPVRVRLHWEASGWQEVTTTARGWTRDLVLVIVDDPRVRVRGVWLQPGDVRRI
jgi:hypothetical protein